MSSVQSYDDSQIWECALAMSTDPALQKPIKYRFNTNYNNK